MSQDSELNELVRATESYSCRYLDVAQTVLHAPFSVCNVKSV
jgi:hypothetical protein